MCPRNEFRGAVCGCQVDERDKDIQAMRRQMPFFREMRSVLVDGLGQGHTRHGRREREGSGRGGREGAEPSTMCHFWSMDPGMESMQPVWIQRQSSPRISFTSGNLVVMDTGDGSRRRRSARQTRIRNVNERIDRTHLCTPHMLWRTHQGAST